MYRKAALASGSTETHVKKEGVASTEGVGLESWVNRIQDTISSIRKGDVFATCTCRI